MTDKLTPKQTLMIWSLLFQGGRALQAQVSPVPKPKDRATFGAMVGVSKLGRATVLELTESGWGWAAGHLTDALPPNFAALRNVLIRLDKHFEKHGEILADFIGPPAPLPQPTSTPKPSTKGGRKAKAPLTDARLKARIKRAYVVVTGVKYGERASLSDLRAQLADIDRDTLDEALTRLQENDKKIQLIRFDNPKEITPTIKAAELIFKGEPVHALWIIK